MLWEPPRPQATPDSTLDYPGDFNFQAPLDWATFPKNPATKKWDKGVYTLRFSLTPLDFTDYDLDNDEHTIRLTVK